MRLCAVIGGLVVAETGSAAIADQMIHYANTCLEQESGDVAGYVVIVSDGEPFPSISLSWSEGAMMLPVAANGNGPRREVQTSTVSPMQESTKQSAITSAERLGAWVTMLGVRGSSKPGV